MELADIKPGVVITEEMARFIECLPEEAKRRLHGQLMAEAHQEEQWKVTYWIYGGWIWAFLSAPRGYVGLKVPSAKDAEYHHVFGTGSGVMG